jgi:long-chain fatty acid transport protein
MPLMHQARYTQGRFCRSVLGLCLALAVGRTGVARASSTLEILGATSGGNQLTARVLSRGSAATYFNPSLLPEASPTIEVGFFGLATQAEIRLKARPAGFDVPDVQLSQDPNARPDEPLPLPTSALPNPRSDTDADENVVYASIGMVRPLAGKSLVFGFYALLPVRAFLDQKGFYPDEREQYFSNKLHFELLGDRLAVSSITFALGSQLADWISIGAGIDVSIFTQTKVIVYMPNGAEQSQVLLTPDIHTDSRFNPYFATTLHVGQRGSLMATLHLPLANKTEGENDLRFWKYPYPAAQNGQTSVRQEYTFSQGSEPLRLAIGGSYRGCPYPDGRVPWEVGLQVVGERWSQYYNRQGEHPQGTWNNTLSYAIGAGFLWKDRHVTADLGYSPSPVPDQTGRTNYVDNSRLRASLGIEGPVKFLGKDLEVGIGLFGSLLLPREATKDLNRSEAEGGLRDEYPDTAIDVRTGLPAQDTAGLQTNNPGFPGWRSWGYMLGAGATFRVAR